MYVCRAEADDEASLSAGSLGKDAILSRYTDMFGEVGVKELGSEDWKVGAQIHMRHIQWDRPTCGMGNGQEGVRRWASR